MAAPPVKSQPLHNFPLPPLKWAHKISPSPSPTATPNHSNKVPQPEEQVAEEDEKPRNLRRKKERIIEAANSPKKENTSVADNKSNNGEVAVKTKSRRLRGSMELGKRKGCVSERKGKTRIWISLSREEIEEDVYAFTGGKPGRRPRKWPKNIQKKMDGLFPGCNLDGVTADSYACMIQ